MIKRYLLSLFLLIYHFTFSQTEIPTVEVKENPKTEITTVTAPKNKEHGVLNIGVNKIKTKNIFATKIENGQITFVLEKEKGDYLYHVVGKTENLPRVARVNNKELAIAPENLQKMEYTYSIDTASDEKNDILNVNIASIKNKDPYIYIGRVNEKRKELLSVFSYRRNLISELSSVTGITGAIKGDIIEAPKKLYMGAGLPGDILKYTGTILKDEWWVEGVSGGFSAKGVDVFEVGKSTSGVYPVATAKIGMNYSIEGIVDYLSLVGVQYIEKAPDSTQGYKADGTGFKITKFYKVPGVFTAPFNSIWGPTTLTTDLELTVPEIKIKVAGIEAEINCGMFEIPQEEFKRTVRVDGVETTSKNPTVMEFLVQRNPIRKKINLSSAMMTATTINGVSYLWYPMTNFKELGYSDKFTPSISGNGASAGIKFTNQGIYIPATMNPGVYNLSVKMVNEYGDSLQKSDGTLSGDFITIEYSTTPYYEGEALLNLSGFGTGSWGGWLPGSSGGENYVGSGYKMIFKNTTDRVFDVRNSKGELQVAKLVVTRSDGVKAEGTAWTGSQLVATFNKDGKSALRFGIQKPWTGGGENQGGMFFINKDQVMGTGDTTYVIEPLDSSGNSLGKLTLTITDIETENVGNIDIAYDARLVEYMKSRNEIWATADGGIGATQNIIERPFGDFAKLTVTRNSGVDDVNIGYWHAVEGKDYDGYAYGYDIYVDGTDHTKPRIALPATNQIDPIVGLEKLAYNIVYNLDGIAPGEVRRENLIFYDTKKAKYGSVKVNIKIENISAKTTSYNLDMSNFLKGELLRYDLYNIILPENIVKDKDEPNNQNYFIKVSSGEKYDFSIFDNPNPSMKDFTVEIKRDSVGIIQSNKYVDDDIDMLLEVNEDTKQIEMELRKLSKNKIVDKKLTGVVKYQNIEVAKLEFNISNSELGVSGSGKIDPTYTDLPVGSIVKFEPLSSPSEATQLYSLDRKTNMILRGNILSPYDGGTTSTITKLIVIKNGVLKKELSVTKGTSLPIVIDFPEVEVGFEGNNLYLKKKIEDYGENKYEIIAYSDNKKLGSFSLEGVKNTFIPSVIQDTITITIDKRLHRYMLKSGFNWLELSTGKISENGNFTNALSYKPLISTSSTASSWLATVDRWTMSTNRRMLQSSIGGFTTFSEERNQDNPGILIGGTASNANELVGKLILNLNELKLESKLETILIGSDGTSTVPVRLIIQEGTRDISRGVGEARVDYRKIVQAPVQAQEIKLIDGDWLQIDIPNNPSNQDLSRYIFTVMGEDGKTPVEFSGTYKSEQLVLKEYSGGFSDWNNHLYEFELPKVKGIKGEKLVPNFWAHKYVAYKHNFKVKAYYRPDPNNPALVGMVELGEFELGAVSTGTECTAEVEFSTFPVGEWVLWPIDLWSKSGNVPGVITSANIPASAVSLNIKRGMMPVHQYISRVSQKLEFAQVFSLEAVQDGKYIGKTDIYNQQDEGLQFNKDSGQSAIFNRERDVYIGYGGYAGPGKDYGGMFYISRPTYGTSPVGFKDLRISFLDHNGLLYGVLNLKLVYNDVPNVGTIDMEVDGRLVSMLADTGKVSSANSKPLLSANGNLAYVPTTLTFPEFIRVTSTDFTMPRVAKWLSVDSRVKQSDTYFSLESGAGTGVILPATTGGIDNSAKLLQSAMFDIYTTPLGGTKKYEIIYEGTDGKKYKVNVNVKVTNPYEKINMKINPLSGTPGKSYTFNNIGISGTTITSVEDGSFIAKLLGGKFTQHTVPNTYALNNSSPGDIDKAYRYKVNNGAATDTLPVIDDTMETIKLVNAKDNATDTQYIQYILKNQGTVSLPFTKKYNITTTLKGIDMGQVDLEIEAKPQEYIGSATLDTSTLGVGDYSIWNSDDIWGMTAPTIVEKSTTYSDFTNFVPKFFYFKNMTNNYDVVKMSITKNNLETKEVSMTTAGRGAITFNDGVEIAISSKGLEIKKTDLTVGTDNYAITLYSTDGTNLGTFTVTVIKGNDVNIGKIILTGKKPLLDREVGGNTDSKWLGKAGILTSNMQEAIGDSTYIDSYWEITNQLTQSIPFKKWVDMTYREVIDRNFTLGAKSWIKFSKEGRKTEDGVLLPNEATTILEAVENGIYRYSEFSNREKVSYVVTYTGTDGRNYSFTLEVVPKIAEKITSSASVEISNMSSNELVSFYNSSKGVDGIILGEENKNIKLNIGNGYLPEFDYSSTTNTATVTGVTGAKVSYEIDGILITTDRYQIKILGRDSTKKVGAIKITKLPTSLEYEDTLNINIKSGNTEIIDFGITVINKNTIVDGSATLDLTKVRKANHLVWNLGTGTDNLTSEKISSPYVAKDTNLEFSGVTFTEVNGVLAILNSNCVNNRSDIVIEISDGTTTKAIDCTLVSISSANFDDLNFYILYSGENSRRFRIVKNKEKVSEKTYTIEIKKGTTVIGRTTLNIQDNTVVKDLGKLEYQLQTDKYKYQNSSIKYVASDGKIYENIANLKAGVSTTVADVLTKNSVNSNFITQSELYLSGHGISTSDSGEIGYTTVYLNNTSGYEIFSDAKKDYAIFTDKYGLNRVLTANTEPNPVYLDLEFMKDAATLGQPTKVADNKYAETVSKTDNVVWITPNNELAKADITFIGENNYTTGSGVVDLRGMPLGGSVEFSSNFTEDGVFTKDIAGILSPTGYFFPTNTGSEFTYEVSFTLLGKETKATIKNNGGPTPEDFNTKASLEIKDGKLYVKRTKVSTSGELKIITRMNGIKINEFTMKFNSNLDLLSDINLTNVRENDVLKWSETNYPVSEKITKEINEKDRSYSGIEIEDTFWNPFTIDDDPFFRLQNIDITKVEVHESKGGGKYAFVPDTNGEVTVDKAKLNNEVEIKFNLKNRTLQITKTTDKLTKSFSMMFYFYAKNEKGEDEIVATRTIYLKDKSSITAVLDETFTIKDNYKYLLPATAEKVEYISNGKLFKEYPFPADSTKEIDISAISSMVISGTKPTSVSSMDLINITEGVHEYEQATMPNFAVLTKTDTVGTKLLDVAIPLELPDVTKGIGNIYTTTPAYYSEAITGEFNRVFNITWLTSSNTLRTGKVNIKYEKVSSDGSGTLNLTYVPNNAVVSWNSEYSNGTTQKATSVGNIVYTVVKDGKGLFAGGFTSALGDFFPTRVGANRLDTTLTGKENVANKLVITKTLAGGKSKTVTVTGTNTEITTTATDFEDIKFSIVNGTFILEKLKRADNATYTITASNNNGELGTFTLNIVDTQQEKTLGELDYSIYDKLIYLLKQKTTATKWVGMEQKAASEIGGLYAYNSTSGFTKTDEFEEYVKTSSTINLPTLTNNNKYKFVGIVKDVSATNPNGTSLTVIDESNGIYGTAGVAEIALGATNVSANGIDSIDTKEIRVNVSTLVNPNNTTISTNYRVKFLNEEDGDIYYFDIKFALINVAMEAKGEINLDGVEYAKELVYDISGKVAGEEVVSSTGGPKLAIKAVDVADKDVPDSLDKVPYLRLNDDSTEIYMFSEIEFELSERLDTGIQDIAVELYTVATNGELKIKQLDITNYLDSSIDGKNLKIKKKVPIKDDLILKYKFIRRTPDGRKERLATNIFTLEIAKDPVYPKDVGLTINGTFLENTGVGTTYTGINLSGLKKLGGTETISADGAISMTDDGKTYTEIKEIISVASVVSNTSSDLNIGNDIGGMKNYGDSVYLPSRSTATTTEELLKEIYFNPDKLKLSETEEVKTVSYKITYMGTDNKYYELTIKIDVKKGVSLDGDAILDFGKLLFNDKEPLHYGETTVKVKGLSKDKKVRIDIPTAPIDKKNIELVSGNNKMNVKNLDVALVTPTPIANNKKLSEATQTDGNATFKIWGYAEVLKDTPVGIYTGETEVEVYVVTD